MSNEKLGSVAILAIELEWTLSLDNDKVKVIDAFAHNGRIKLKYSSVTVDKFVLSVLCTSVTSLWSCKL